MSRARASSGCRSAGFTWIILLLLGLSPGAGLAQAPAARSSGEPASLPHLAPGEIHGIITGPNGIGLQGARIVLTGRSGAAAGESITAFDGSFSIQGVEPGTLTLGVSLGGFEPTSTSIDLAAGESKAVPPLVLKLAAVKVSLDVVASQQEVAEAQLHFQEQQRIGGVLPNFYVSYDWNAAPLTTGQKFRLALKNASDPGNLLLVGTVAGVQQATDAFNGYGQGAKGYGRRYGADLGNLVSGTFLGGAVLPSLFHQDPRYFYKGKGSVRSRAMYAISSVVICRGDNGRRQPAWASVLGDLSAGAISNLYYAPSDRQGAVLTLTNGLLGVAGDALNNIFQEFFLPKLTHRLHPSAPVP